MVAVTDQFIAVDMNWDGKVVRLIFIYTKCDYILRRELLLSLGQLMSSSFPVIFVGDYNIVKNEEERAGGLPVTRVAKNDFIQFIDSHGLYDLPFLGSKFTWFSNCNGSMIWERLDRALTNHACLDQFPNSIVNHLERSHSDHAPLLIQLVDPRRSSPSPFRFQRMWLQHPLFLHVIAESWNRECHLSGLQRMAFKLKRLKGDLKLWNKVVFGNIFQRLNDARDKILLLENQLLSDDSVTKELMELKCSYDHLLLQEEIYRKQQSRVKWLEEGDRNTALFNAMARENQQKIHVSEIMGPSCILTDTQQILGAAVEFFKSHLDREIESGRDLSPMLSLVPNLVTSEDNEMLLSVISKHEVYDAVKGIPEDSAPSPNGFSSSSYIHAWAIISDDLIAAVQEFFAGALCADALGASIISLIQTKDKLNTFLDFRPISIC
ncbi:uncharacterized protein LOC111398252 [Olea europaea var. sylvestris]|uniref:uncharacterized protein LOC111398252 n=1 Tax=Olea europaea var. sylvestris TaxID=158386 RepID=UPI000C1CD85B|nr:uncharacterized protein LOC111398252 [Olea europaea var. sylvestris]